MKTILPTNSALLLDQEDQQQEQQQQAQEAATTTTGGPLVVFPALPYQPTILSRLAPLSWFLVPLLRTVDKEKQDLADLYPDRVLYVAAPDKHTLDQLENEENDTTIPVLLQLNDIRVDVQERIEKLMRQYYGTTTRKPTSDDASHNDWPEGGEEDDTSCYCASSRPPRVISADGIHPSDKGYEAWGEHIARKIVQEWEERTKRAPTPPPSLV